MSLRKITKSAILSTPGYLCFSLQIAFFASKYMYSTVQIFNASYYSNAAPIDIHRFTKLSSCRPTNMKGMGKAYNMLSAENGN